MSSKSKHIDIMHYIHALQCACVCVRARSRVCMCVRVYACVCVCMCVHVYERGAFVFWRAKKICEPNTCYSVYYDLMTIGLCMQPIIIIIIDLILLISSTQSHKPVYVYCYN